MKISKWTIFLINTVLVLLVVMLFDKIHYALVPLVSVKDILLIPGIISLFIYYALRPIVRRFEKTKINKGLLIAITMITCLVIIVTFFAYGGVAVKDQFTNSFSYDMESVKNFISTIDNKLGGMLTQFDFTQKILDTLREYVMVIFSGVMGVFSQVGNIGTQVVLVPFFVFYLLKEDRGFGKWLVKIIPIKYREKSRETFLQIDNALTTYISGQLTVALVIGILMYIGYLIIGMPNALLMAFFCMITSIIPFIGPFLGIIPAILIGLTMGYKMIILVVVVAIVVQQLEGSLITPKIMGSKLKVHPLLVMVIVIVSVNLFGILGAFVGIPVFVILSIVVKTIFKARSMKKIDI